MSLDNVDAHSRGDLLKVYRHTRDHLKRYSSLSLAPLLSIAPALI